MYQQYMVIKSTVLLTKSKNKLLEKPYKYVIKYIYF